MTFFLYHVTPWTSQSQSHLKIANFEMKQNVETTLKPF